jgi:hypothetical protein
MATTEEIDKLIAIADKYYSNPKILEQIFPFINKREVAFITKQKSDYFMLRNRKIDQIGYIHKQIVYFMQQNKVFYNFYCSLCRFKNGIMFCRDDKQKKYWFDNYYNYIRDIDIGFDFDAEKESEIAAAKKDVLYISSFLTSQKYEHRILFSGFGFQLVVPFSSLPDCVKNMSFNPYEKDSFFHYASDFVRGFSNKCKTLDTKVLDSRRVFKVPYSLVYNPKKSKKLFVAYPLDPEYLKKEWKLKFMVYDEKKI